MSVAENFQKIRSGIPSHVKIVAAAKTRTTGEVEELIKAGITDIGENYVQEAEEIIKSLKPELIEKVNWHLIGHLQKNKINKALPIFNLIQSVDSLDLAREINKRVQKAGKEYISILLEINIGSEFSKHGIQPDKSNNIDFEEYIEKLAREISLLPGIRMEGLMTMGPQFDDPEKLRPFFKKTKKIFTRLATLNLERLNMKYLSMGMSNSYKVAIEEGANMVRIGTAIFGPR
ncbi:MAG: YggS family pyridoxal phosphate-dependent enzyme [Atribacterota bacterium]|nr:YggS family pyridoxal phosphate-dependent enzyme [Atribacterota bacterium]